MEALAGSSAVATSLQRLVARQSSGASLRPNATTTTYRRLTCTCAAAGDGDAGQSSEPKWKQKLAAAEAHAEQTRQATARAQEEYRRKQMVQRKSEVSGGAAAGPAAAAAGTGAAAGAHPRLVDLDWVPYLTEEGLLTDCTQAGAKASVYAIYDDDKVLQYIGVSRQVYQSMRLHFARVPSACAWMKVTHITRPSKAVLEAIKDQWIAENGVSPPGNDEGPEQNRWENPLDCKPLMTEEERKSVEYAAPGPPKAKALKEVARRVERELEAAFKARNCKEVLRFDPKLKEDGLLDLKSTAARAPDTAVPTSTPQATKA
ncbi:hypothetical protein CLOM_g23729 [Closterium sp. NIES-68]|nr:hypothetical protein CLOM_g23729 [Closterium sp. NIES-68]GJP66438.1 hypothetical protein CLOP_g23372 [Closterium sp. NIES-67]GJP80885.1 hypothetical protein CLOP_g11084 [Closterium sp. NIES-67]